MSMLKWGALNWAIMPIKMEVNKMTALIKRNKFPLDIESAIDKFILHEFPSFTEIFGNRFFSEGAYPRIDIRDYADKAMVIAEIPGLTKEDITLDYKDGILSILGKKREQKEEKDEKFESIVKEIKYSSFCRKITIPEGYDMDNIKAKHDGINLEITIPKKIKEEVKNSIPIE